MDKIIIVGNDQYIIKCIIDMSTVDNDGIERLKISRRCDSLITDKNHNRYILANKIDEAEYTEI